jgi:lipid-binding SYLF domain-containing protein
MTTDWQGTRVVGRASRWAAVALIVAGWLGASAPARADDARDAAALVDRARFIIEAWEREPGLEPFPDLAKNAKGVLIIPQFIRAAFIFGGQGGNGVMLARDPSGKWQGPAFVVLGGGSFGFQAGVDAAEVVMLIMTDRGVTNMLNPTAKFGVDMSVTGGPVGAGLKGETAGISADVVTFSRAKGLYGGVSVEGGTVWTRDGFNGAYYAKSVSPTDILIRGSGSNPHGDQLRAAVVKLAGGK